MVESTYLQYLLLNTHASFLAETQPNGLSISLRISSAIYPALSPSPPPPPFPFRSTWTSMIPSPSISTSTSTSTLFSSVSSSPSLFLFLFLFPVHICQVHGSPRIKDLGSYPDPTWYTIPPYPGVPESLAIRHQVKDFVPKQTKRRKRRVGLEGLGTFSGLETDM
ncbi:hypothetical protein CLAIMM_11071 isoform 2 [Cladophialophora immunda]|nr:hypothetical protein CLAIMM_11071 isoform 2 [Cladophialophora immunda]